MATPSQYSPTGEACHGHRAASSATTRTSGPASPSAAARRRTQPVAHVASEFWSAGLERKRSACGRVGVHRDRRLRGVGDPLQARCIRTVQHVATAVKEQHRDVDRVGEHVAQGDELGQRHRVTARIRVAQARSVMLDVIGRGREMDGPEVCLGTPVPREPARSTAAAHRRASMPSAGGRLGDRPSDTPASLQDISTRPSTSFHLTPRLSDGRTDRVPVHDDVVRRRDRRRPART